MSRKHDIEALKNSFHAVAVYDMGETPPPLADFRGVLQSMHGGGDGTFLLPEIKNKMVTDTWPDDAPKVLSLLDGSHPSGFRLAIVKAMAGEKEISMPVVEDPVTMRSLAIGPDALPKKLVAQFGNAGITYVSGTDADARDAITKFFIDTVTERLKLQQSGETPAYFTDSQSGNQFAQDFLMAAISTAAFARDAALFKSASPAIADALLPISQGQARTVIYTAAATACPV